MRCAAPTISLAWPARSTATRHPTRRRRLLRGRVRLVEQVDEMPNVRAQPERANARGDLMHAAGVRGDHQVGPGLPERRLLLLEDLPLVPRLDEIVDPCAAAAAVGSLHLAELQPGDPA